MNPTPPGWYHDPWQQAPMRWWDGSRWTEHTADWRGIRPVVRPSYGPSVAERFQNERQLTPWLQRLLFLWPIAVALSLGGLVSSMNQLVDGDDPGSLGSYWWVGQLGGLAAIALLVMRILWLYRAATVARELGLDARREPTRAAVGWLIPIVNYWWPYQAMTDLFPEDRRPNRRIAWWWTCSVLSQFSLLVAIAVPFVPVPAAVGLVVLVLVPALAAAALEVALVHDATAVHGNLVAGS